MWCYNLPKNHGLLLSIFIIVVEIDSLSSSTANCKCERVVANAKCSQQTGCKVVCNNGYWGKKCEFGRIRLTSESGYITEGIGDYSVHSKFMWLIDAGNRLNANIHFQIEEFFTECNWDYLYIFDGDSTYSPLLATLNGHLTSDVNSTHLGRIPQKIIAKSGKAFIYFYSDLGVARKGFNISYRIIENCPCLNGSCTTAGLCTCDAGWTGALCNMRRNCSSTSCTNGVCNNTLGICVCNDGFTGDDCSQSVTSSYWTSLKIRKSDVDIPPRSSHTAGIIGDHMWVYNGYRFSDPKRKHQDLYKYNLKDKTWSRLTQENELIWGHSMIVYQGKLIVFGGERIKDARILNTLAVFDTNSSQWSYPDLLNSSQSIHPIAVTGHTATLVEDKMIVIFGLTKTGLFPGIQEYDIVNAKWNIIQDTSARGNPRHGHSSVYDPFSRRIYVYGGVVMEKNSFVASDSLMVYFPHSRTWAELAASKYRQTLHSAVLIDRMMVVFGGNPYLDYKTHPAKCHTTKLHVYDLTCQKWYSENLPQVVQTMARYGHTAVDKERTMYIFGGFNGALFNDVLTYTHGDCERILNKSECMGKYFSAGCYWNKTKCVNKESLKSSPQCPVMYQTPCNETKSCDECSSNPKCGWTNETCQAHGSKKCPIISEDICPFFSNCASCKTAGCYWNDSKGCRKDRNNHNCSSTCTDLKSPQTCVSRSCIWCENIQRCVHDDMYVVYYPYGQCFEWTTRKSDHEVITCESMVTCRDCLTLPSCGWRETPMRSGAGDCLEGSASGPRDGSNYGYWHFIDCPLCQCNGHSNCSVNSSVCLNCRDHATGEKCETCAYGYYGKSLNGEKCKPCQCNGHADTCDSEGKCSCNMKGATGDHCEKCQSSQYDGNSTNGGYCYYRLTPDYLYRINVSSKTIFNFICSPREDDKNTIVSVSIVKGDPLHPALLNVSIGSDVLEEVFHITNVELTSKYEEKFSKDNYPFGSNNFHFKIYVYNIPQYSSVSVSVHQPNENGINLLKFFIIFLACFIGLLFFAVVFWKAKVFLDTFRRTRRRNVELVYMTNRPFASVPICVDKPGHVPMKSKPSPLTSEICRGSKAAVVTVLVRLPVCAQTETSSGGASLCLGSTLVNYSEHHSSKMVNYMKNIKRRRNPFRSTPG
ncbi:attractin-like isoform X2 [Dendronephthya gigantea]|uniref:attractin-like isoform X2 n=1 Tax=Dendronephthya gigantea TaxID=151771 RepID=UPI0010690787|nr:attractin-like isoform X2 [Dendronephthya gigantea]